MKKRLIATLLLLVISLTSCAVPDTAPLPNESDTDGAPSFSASDGVESNDVTRETTEAPTEKPTEEVTESPIPCSHDYPQDAVDQLIAEGQDVEQLNFQRGPDVHFQYVVVLNKRVVRHGQQLRISTAHMVSGGDVVEIQKLYEFFHEGDMSPLTLRSASNERIPIELVNTPDRGSEFIFTVPDDMAPGVYELELDLRNENMICLCKIVIY